ncbi:hypothetical protein [Aeromonas phage 4_4512]|nr:hypothetical protein [Aeromonas phage 4_4512]
MQAKEVSRQQKAGELEMKISKSKQELARIISENGGWRDGGFAAQDGDGGVGWYEVKPEWDSLAKYWWRGASDQWFLANKIKNHHQTALSRAEYFHLYPATDDDGWIEWKGGECPVGEGDRIDAKFSDGDEFFDVSSDWDWGVDAGGCNIIAYRPHKPEQAKPEFCESVMLSIPEPDEQVWTNPPTIEQLASDYRNAKDFAERKQEEADDAKADADAKLKALKLAGEAVGLIVSPITDKQEPRLVITDWRDLRVGDEVEYVSGLIKSRNGMVGVVVDTEDEDDGLNVKLELHDGEFGWPTKWRFIRRP